MSAKLSTTPGNNGHHTTLRNADLFRLIEVGHALPCKTCWQ